MPLLTINRYLSNIPNKMYQYFNYWILNRITVKNKIELRLQLLSLKMINLNNSVLYLSNDCFNSVLTCILILAA